MIESSPTVRFVLAEAGAERVGVSDGEVRPPFAIGRIARVPWSPAWMLGTVLHEGQILTVVDLAQFAGFGDAGSSPVGLIPSAGDQQIVLAVRAAVTAVGPPTIRGRTDPEPEWLNDTEEVLGGVSFRRLRLKTLIERVIASV